MFSIKLLLLAVLLCTSAFAQTIVTPSPDVQALVANNTAVLTVLNNYFGCAKWDGTVCIQCSQHYFFNAKGICC